MRDDAQIGATAPCKQQSGTCKCAGPRRKARKRCYALEGHVVRETAPSEPGTQVTGWAAEPSSMATKPRAIANRTESTQQNANLDTPNNGAVGVNPAARAARRGNLPVACCRGLTHPCPL